MNIKPIKVMFAVSLYEINGACAVAKNLIDNLNRQKFEILLIAERIARRHFDLDPDVKIIDLGLKSQKGIINKILNISSHIKKIKEVILAERPDIVLSFGTVLNCYVLFSLSKVQRQYIKLVITEHSEGFFINYSQPYFKDKVLRIIYKIMMFFSYRKSDCIIAVSYNIASSLRKLLGNEKEIRVIYNPVNILKIKRLCEEEVGDFNFEYGIPYLAIVSRLSPEKSIGRLIEAFANLNYRLDSRLIIIGDGQERNKLEDIAKSYGLREKINFIGWQYNPFKFLKKAEVFVLSSIYEGFPNVILEAMACGIPVVALKSSGGIEEVIEDGINGVLVNSEDPAVLSSAIYNLLLNKELKGKIINQAYKRLDRFDVSKIVNEYESMMLGLVGSN